MKTLIVEDDFTSRLLLQEILKAYGPCHIAVNGKEAAQAVRAAWETNEPYQLICLDIMLPEVDGQAVLADIRAFEAAREAKKSQRSKIVMTTALGDSKSVMSAFQKSCDAYVVKPVDKAKLLGELRKLALVE